MVTVKVRYEDSLHHSHPSLQRNRRNGIQQFVKAALIRNFMYEFTAITNSGRRSSKPREAVGDYATQTFRVSCWC